MFLVATKSVEFAHHVFVSGRLYEVADAIGTHLVRTGYATPIHMPTDFIANYMTRLNDGAGEPCLFLPFTGEFGHKIMSHVRLVNFHRAKSKIVCCRPGEEVLYPSANAFETNWIDPISDLERVATMRGTTRKWPQMAAKYPNHHHISFENLSPTEEIHAIYPEVVIPMRPHRRGLNVDVVLGVRHRQNSPQRNWGAGNWQRVADAITEAGLTFGVVGDKATSFGLRGQHVHSGDYDTHAAVELLQSCRLYVGTDSGASHLASTVQTPMVVFRETASGSRGLLPRMAEVNYSPVIIIDNGWTEVEAVISTTLEILSSWTRYG
jgi:hypothetical protein